MRKRKVTRIGKFVMNTRSAWQMTFEERAGCIRRARRGNEEYDSLLVECIVVDETA